MKKLILTTAWIIACMLASPSMFAQSGEQDMVYLKNGSMVRGLIAGTSENGDVRLETVDGSVWVFAAADILKVEKVDAYRAKRKFEISERGFYNASSAGILAGSDDFGSVLDVSATTVLGYKINRHYSVGLGAGIESISPSLAPFFLEGRYNLLEGRFTPFLALQSGYAVPLENYKDGEGKWINKGGFMGNAEIGVMNYLGSNVALTFSAGYRYQRSSVRQDYWWFGEGDSGVIHYDYHRIVVRAGILFN